MRNWCKVLWTKKTLSISVDHLPFNPTENVQTKKDYCHSGTKKKSLIDVKPYYHYQKSILFQTM